MLMFILNHHEVLKLFFIHCRYRISVQYSANESATVLEESVQIETGGFYTIVLQTHDTDSHEVRVCVQKLTRVLK